jgi:adenine phosphoribosyltransferase
MDQLKSLIREVPDFPKPGINFYDITTLLKDSAGFRAVLDTMISRFKGAEIQKVVGIEARGYIFAPVVAYAIGAGFVPVRKPGKLPAHTVEVEYALEYGTDRLQMHADAVQPGENVLIVDDVLATGGTASAVARLVEAQGARVNGFGFVIELDFLPGRAKLAGYEIYSMLHY